MSTSSAVVFSKGFQKLVYILEMLGNISKISGLSFDEQTIIVKLL